MVSIKKQVKTGLSTLYKGGRRGISTLYKGVNSLNKNVFKPIQKLASKIEEVPIVGAVAKPFADVLTTPIEQLQYIGKQVGSTARLVGKAGQDFITTQKVPSKKTRAQIKNEILDVQKQIEAGRKATQQALTRAREAAIQQRRVYRRQGI